MEKNILENIINDDCNNHNAGFIAKKFNKEEIKKICKNGISTGFKSLDSVLGSGFREGELVVLGAMSSLGKSTLALQIACNQSNAKVPVIYFSLEMDELNIVAKNIAREMKRLPNTYHKFAKSSSELLSNQALSFDVETWEAIDIARENATKQTDKLIIKCPTNNQQIVADFIYEYVKKFIEIKNEKPVVYIDYLQIIPPPANKQNITDKQNIDNTIRKLKRICDDFGVVVVVISSLNRQSYDSKISKGAFKESGSIEYSADVLLGMQFAGTGTDGFDIDEATRSDPRKVEMHVLKNRYGRIGDVINFDFYPRHSLFKEQTATLLHKTPVLK